MNNVTIEDLAVAIAAKEADLHRIADIASRCNADRRAKETAAAGKAGAVAAATAALAGARVAEALGTAQPGAEAAAAVGLAAAQKALAAEGKAEGKAEGDIAVLQAQEAAYAARVAALQAELAELRIDRKQAFIDAQAAELPNLIAAYTTLAPKTMEALGRAYALHLHLSSLGRDPGMFSPGLHDSQLGSFVGSPLNADMGQIVARERLRLSAEAMGA